MTSPDKYSYFNEHQALTDDIANISYEVRQLDWRRQGLMAALAVKLCRLSVLNEATDWGETEQEWLRNE